MNLATRLTALREEIRGLTPIEQAKLCCGVAKQFEKVGEYEGAREALSEFWPEVDDPPNLDGLDEPTKAELLLRIGALAGWLGSTGQTEGSQETAKNFITRSIEIFERLERSEKAAEARSDLALCYWREGSYDEARIHLANALTVLGNEDSDLRAILLIRAGIVEVWSRRLDEGLRFYDEAIPSVERSQDHALKGSFHFEYGLVLRRLASPENREDYLDRALIEYAAASFHYAEAGNERALARVENNLGYLFFTIGRYKEAHNHLNRARRLFLDLRDLGTSAQVDDTRARLMLAEGRIREAERLARSSVKTLEHGGEQALLAEALTTYGVALARTGKNALARATLQRAAEIAQTSGDLEGAGRAQLSLIEELGEQTSAKELVTIYQSAGELLHLSQDPATAKRLVTCASKVINALSALVDAEENAAEQTGLSFKQQVVMAERRLIERALKDSGGVVTRAARLLGFKHHQSLISLINTRHKELLKTRSAVRKRRRHLFSESRRDRRNLAVQKTGRAKSQVFILYAEDNAAVSGVIDEMLSAENWSVDLCRDGDRALKKLAGEDHYDLLLFDNELPGLSGLELVRRARKMAHRRRTPIIVLSGSDCETEAWSAGVDAFLRKPEDIDQVPSTIARVLKMAPKKYLNSRLSATPD